MNKSIARLLCRLRGHDDRCVVGQDRATSPQALQGLLYDHVTGRTALDFTSGTSYRRCYRCKRVEGRVATSRRLPQGWALAALGYPTED